MTLGSVLLFVIVSLGSATLSARGLVEVRPSTHPFWVEHPDGRLVDYNDQIHSTIVTRLSERGLIQPIIGEGRLTHARLTLIPNAVSFAVGTRGNRDLYGVDAMGRTLELDTDLDLSINEFSIPKEDPTGRHPFYASFRKRGTLLTGSHAGLDLGDGFELDLLFAFMNLKYARFEANVDLELSFQHTTLPIRRSVTLHSKKRGSFFDFTAGYLQFQGGLQVARSNAMERALQKIFSQSTDHVESILKSWPWIARVTDVDSHFVFIELSGSGPDSIGKVFQSLDGRIALRVIAEPVNGRARSVWIRAPEAPQESASLILTENHPLTLEYMQRRSRPQFALKTEASFSSDFILNESDGLNFGPLSDRILGERTTSRLIAALRSVAGLVLLPYRIWRFKRTDQPMRPEPRSNTHEQNDARASIPVAIIDTGIDYNHPKLIPFMDRTRLSWDFSSGDSRAYDDAWRGTVIAASVLDRTHAASLVSVKAFNPWGQTHSRTLYQSFAHALKSGAKILVAAWASDRESTLADPLARMLDAHDAILVTTAGNRIANVDRISYFPTHVPSEGVIVTTALKSDLSIYRRNREGVGYGARTVDVAVPLPKNWSAPLPRGNSGEVSALPDRSAGFVAGALAERWSEMPEATRDEVIRRFLEHDTILRPEVRSWTKDGRVLKARPR